MKTFRSASACFFVALFGLALQVPLPIGAQPFIYLTEVPDYSWHAGCFGTATGNLAGFWDRHGLSNVYAGTIDGGVAPLSDSGRTGIRSLWASQAGLDGRPSNKPGHIDDYYFSYEYTGADPYVTAGRVEHTPDCIGDFIGLSQNKWTNLASECRGNIDAFSFVFWDKTGNRRSNYYTTNYNTTNTATYVPDIGSGLKEWMRWRGYDADVFTQLTDFNPERSTSAGFTYADVKREIDAGYPVLCFLQPAGEFNRTVAGVPNVNPEIHGVMIYGYFTDTASGYDKGVIIRTSWGTGETFVNWGAASWLGLFPVRGVIGFHPKPTIRTFTHSGGNLTIAWEGPSTYLYDDSLGTTSGPLQKYLVQRATNLSSPDWKTVAGPITEQSATIPQPTDSFAFYRVVIQP
jgi:hypothetical protein